MPVGRKNKTSRITNRDRNVDKKIINLRQGSNPADDNRPELFLKALVKKGPIQAITIDLAPHGSGFLPRNGMGYKWTSPNFRS